MHGEGGHRPSRGESSHRVLSSQRGPVTQSFSAYSMSRRGSKAPRVPPTPRVATRSDGGPGRGIGAGRGCSRLTVFWWVVATYALAQSVRRRPGRVRDFARGANFVLLDGRRLQASLGLRGQLRYARLGQCKPICPGCLVLAWASLTPLRTQPSMPGLESDHRPRLESNDVDRLGKPPATAPGVWRP
ncbi:hypothetical protein GQ53DRAFT_85797 [Thozetella sp. PMI_491]|nr:hypothetical protein GQ53DRAFT_85797 [Thozetella sp. PMI_491]